MRPPRPTDRRCIESLRPTSCPLGRHRVTRKCTGGCDFTSAARAPVRRGMVSGPLSGGNSALAQGPMDFEPGKADSCGGGFFSGSDVPGFSARWAHDRRERLRSREGFSTIRGARDRRRAPHPITRRARVRETEYMRTRLLVVGAVLVVVAAVAVAYDIGWPREIPTTNGKAPPLSTADRPLQGQHPRGPGGDLVHQNRHEGADLRRVLVQGVARDRLRHAYGEAPLDPGAASQGCRRNGGEAEGDRSVPRAGDPQARDSDLDRPPGRCHGGDRQGEPGRGRFQERPRPRSSSPTNLRCCSSTTASRSCGTSRGRRVCTSGPSTRRCRWCSTSRPRSSTCAAARSGTSRPRPSGRGR